MYITWFGQSCFKIQGKEVILVTDPYDAETGFKLPRMTADILTVSHNHHDHNNTGAIYGHPFLINNPGEYEIKKVFIYGVPSWHDNREGSQRGPNTIYLFEFEEMKIAHLGDLGSQLTDDQLEKLEGIDILMIPVGGVYTIDAKQAAEVISQVEPRIVIPMHYKIPGLKVNIDNLEKFSKEMGVKEKLPEEKFRVTKKDLPQEETKVLILKKYDPSGRN